MGKKKWTGPNERRHHGKRNDRGARRGGHAKHHQKDKKPYKPTRDFPDKKANLLSNNNFVPKNNLFEKDIGVTEYTGDHAGFTGIIKSRFSDFQVNEIDLDGNVAKLTSTSLPVPPPKIDNLTENESEVIKLITEEVWIKIDEVAKAAQTTDVVEIDVTDLTKEQRSLIHNTIKEIHGRSIVGSTVTKSDRKFIKFAKYNKSAAFDKRTKWLWPHEFTHFLVHKENVDTMKAASDLAQNLNINPSSIAYAGTKDKRGKTTQWFSIRKCQPDKIARAAERFPKVHVGNFTFKPEQLKLGSLKGNRFRIALRHVTEDEKDVEKSVENLRENGFINYYGLQRFGNNAEIPTHKIGVALLKGQYQEACELILKPREGEQHFMKDIREHWWRHRDAQAALKMFFKGNKGIEAKLLAGLARNGPNDFVNALENIPRNMRLLYIHAYQSLIWNEIVSKRINKFGLKLHPGDLVYVDAVDVPNAQDCIDDVDLVNAIDEQKDEDTEDKAAIEPEIVSEFKSKVKPLTADDISSGTYNIFDIVLPLPGHDITYPSNECAAWYEERLAVDGLSSEKLKQKHKGYSLTGAYRKVFVKPENFSWHFMNYKTELDNLIQSDFEEFKGLTVPKSDEEGDLKALIIDFCLPSSSYATMALRELLKADTSASNQTKLNHIETGLLGLTKGLQLHIVVPGSEEDHEIKAEKRKTNVDGLVDGESSNEDSAADGEQPIDVKKRKLN